MLTGDDALTSEIFNRGPIDCGIDASKILDYTSGTASGYSLNADHIISVVGWSKDETERKYRMVQHSWGEFWGEQEYIRVKAGWFSNLALGEQSAWVVPGDFSVPESDDTIHCWGLDRIESLDISFNDEYEWESDFPDGGAGANVYAFDTGINVNNRDIGGWVINRYSCLSLCAEVGSCTDNDAQGHGIHVAGTAAGHQYGVAKHAIFHGMQVIGSEGGSTITGVLNAMDEVVSSLERQIFQMSIASSASTMRDTVVNTATNDYDAIGPLPWPTVLPAPGYVPKTNPLNGRWVIVTEGDAELIKKSIMSGMLGSAEASKIQAGNHQSDGCSYSPGRAAPSFNVGSHDLDDGISYFSNFACVDPCTSRGEYNDRFSSPSDEVVKETEAMAVEVEAVDFPEVDADGKDEATLRDVVAEEVVAPVVGAPTTGGVFDRFPQSSGRMRLVNTPLWSLRYPMCPIIGKAALRDEGERYANDRDAFAAQEERCSSWRRANTGGVVACGVQGPLVDGSGKLPGAGSAGDGHA